MSTLADMRHALNLAGNTRDADRWTAEEWLLLRAAYAQASHDYTPDDWQDYQIQEALSENKAPHWCDAEGPTRGKVMR